MTRLAVLLLLIAAVTGITGSTIWLGRPALISGLLVVSVSTLVVAGILLLQKVDDPPRRDDE